MANEFYKCEYSLTIKNCIQQGTQISAFKLKENGVCAIEVCLTELITQVIEYFNLRNNMNAMQIIRLSQTIQRKYYFLKLEEIVMILRDGKDGVFGKTLQLSPDIIMGWFDSYDTKRMNYVHDIRTLEHDKNKKGNITLPILSNEDLKRFYKQEDKESKLDFSKKDRSIEKKKEDKDFKDFYLDYLSKKLE